MRRPALLLFSLSAVVHRPGPPRRLWSGGEGERRVLNPRRLVVLLTTALASQKLEEDDTRVGLTKLAKFVLSDRGATLRRVMVDEAEGALDVVGRRNARLAFKRASELPLPPLRVPLPTTPPRLVEAERLVDLAAPPLDADETALAADILDLSRSLLAPGDPLLTAVEALVLGESLEWPIVGRVLVDVAALAALGLDDAVVYAGRALYASQLFRPVREALDSSDPSTSLRLLRQVAEALDDAQLETLRAETLAVLSRVLTTVRARVDPLLREEEEEEEGEAQVFPPQQPRLT